MESEHTQCQSWRFSLVVDEKTQRGDWPLARIRKTFPGKDDTVCVYEVKTKAGQCKNPVAKLALLGECSI